MKFSYFIMGDFQSKDQAAIYNGSSQIIRGSQFNRGVCSGKVALYEDGVSCIERYWEFDESKAKEIFHAIKNKFSIGCITHVPEQNTIYQSTFSK